MHYTRWRRTNPETRVRDSEYRQRPEVRERCRAYGREYWQRPEVRESRRKYQQRPEVRERQYDWQWEFRERNRAYFQRQQRQQALRRKEIPSPRNGLPYTAAEDAIVMRDDISIKEICYLLGRSYSSVVVRRSLLRRKAGAA
jgi:hypothetical protein